LSFQIFIMPPAVVFVEEDSQVHEFHEMNDDLPMASGGENWDEELLVPGRMVYVGQGQSHYMFFDEPDPGLMYPKKKKKKKSASQPPPSPAPAPLSPAPIDWSDWEEMCQFSPPPPPPPVMTWEPEDWEAEISPPWQPEDWDAEISASQDREDWDAEISASQ
jgi:hypothetical protein